MKVAQKLPCISTSTQRSHLLRPSLVLRSVSTSTQIDNLVQTYNQVKQSIFSTKTHGPQESPEDVFVTNEIDLNDVQVYGFDYDYTLATYNNQLQPLIYQLAAQSLVKNKKYPPESCSLPYDPNFAIRGLHYDVKRGLLMKIDAFQNIQMGTVYRGHRPLSEAQTLQLYNGAHVAQDYMQAYMPQLTDLFSLPEACLLANVIQYMTDSNIRFDPEYLYWDVAQSIRDVHQHRTMHHEVMRNISLYLNKDPAIEQLLTRLHKSGKKLFLLTNSPYDFVNEGMSYLVGPLWRELFDVVIVEAHKPKFFNFDRPFRQFDTTIHSTTWTHVTKLKQGSVYCEGNINDFSRITGWHGGSVLYIGDHVYSDLLDPSRRQGWRTAAIIQELQHEIKILNTPEHHQHLTWFLNLQRFIKKLQVIQDPQKESLLKSWQDERAKVSSILKYFFNHQFGSVFRTFHNPSFFAHKVSRLADLYTSSSGNFLNYPLHHTFIPNRVFLPHEPQPRRDGFGNYCSGV